MDPSPPCRTSNTNMHKTIPCNQQPWSLVFGRSCLAIRFVNLPCRTLGIAHLLWSIPSLDATRSGGDKQNAFSTSKTSNHKICSLYFWVHASFCAEKFLCCKTIKLLHQITGLHPVEGSCNSDFVAHAGILTTLAQNMAPESASPIADPKIQIQGVLCTVVIFQTDPQDPQYEKPLTPTETC